MTEERTQYTVHSDIAVRLEVSEKHIKHLTSTIDGMTMVMGRHADTITAQRERIVELEQTVLRQSETIARLEQDNRRLRHLDAMPLDAMRRQFLHSSYVDAIDTGTYDPTQADADMQDVGNWLFPQDGAA